MFHKTPNCLYNYYNTTKEPSSDILLAILGSIGFGLYDLFIIWMQYKNIM